MCDKIKKSRSNKISQLKYKHLKHSNQHEIVSDNFTKWTHVSLQLQHKMYTTTIPWTRGVIPSFPQFTQSHPAPKLDKDGEDREAHFRNLPQNPRPLFQPHEYFKNWQQRLSEKTQQHKKGIPFLSL